MHSSRMRTAHYLPYGGSLSRGLFLSGGSLSEEVSVQRGLCTGGISVRGVSVQRGSLSRGGLGPGGISVRETPPCGQTDSCEIITLPQTSFMSGNEI